MGTTTESNSQGSPIATYSVPDSPSTNTPTPATSATSQNTPPTTSIVKSTNPTAISSTPGFGVTSTNAVATPYPSQSATETFSNATFTNATAVRSPINTSPAKKSTKVLTAGGGAGIAIGSLLLGVFFAFLGAWLIMKGRKSSGGSRRHSRREKSEYGNYGAEEGAVTRPELKVEDNVPERADDSDLRKSMQDLNEIIDLHCENYYHLNLVDIHPGEAERRLVELGYQNMNTSGPSATDLVAMLQNPRSRYSCIRMLIAVVILSHIDWKTGPEVSLLPVHIAAFFQKIPPIERQPGSEEIFNRAFTKWRQLCAFLLEPVRSNREAPKANERELRNAIDQNVRLINSVLGPFVKPGTESARSQENNLRAILFEGAQLGLLLFSQPSIWVPRWTSATGQDFDSEKRGQSHASTTNRNRTLVVFPALGELIERHGTKRWRFVTDPVEAAV